MSAVTDPYEPVTIRLMRGEDVEAVWELATLESWNYSIEMVQALFEANETGSFVAVVEDKVVGVIMGANLSDTEAFGGFWIVSKEARGKRIGTQLWKKRKEHVGKRNFGINSVSHRVEPNKKLGYTTASWRVSHLSGTVDTESLQLPENYGFSVVPYRESEFNSLVEYDTKVHTIERRNFVKKWLGKGFTVTFVATRSNENDIVGYGVIQKSEIGNFLGPIYGDSPDILKILLAKLMNNAPFGDTIDMFSPADSDIVTELLEKNKGTFKQRYAPNTRMYLYHEVQLPVNKVLALATVETTLL